MRTLRDIYWLILLLFVAANLLFVFRTQASFWAIGLSPATLDSHRLSPDDYDRLDDAGDIVRQIIVITAITSLVTSLASILVLRSGIVRFRWLPMVVMAASAAWGIYLLLQGNRFAYRTPMVSECASGPLREAYEIAAPTPRSVGIAMRTDGGQQGIRRTYRIQQLRHQWRVGAIPATARSFVPAERRSYRTSSSSERFDERRSGDEVVVAGRHIIAEPLPWSMVEGTHDAVEEWNMEAMQ